MPERKKQLGGLEGWLRERLIRHRGNADVVRQDLLAEKDLAVSRRTLQRAVQPYRQELKPEALATRFEATYLGSAHCGNERRKGSEDEPQFREAC